MHRRLRLWAAMFIGAGAVVAFTDRGREVATWLLIAGLMCAVAFLLMDRFGRR